MISIIAAMANNNVIGVDNKLPWHLPDDFAWFKKITLNKPVIMGRKTFESIGRPLPQRTNIVISRKTDLTIPEGIVWAHSLQQALDAAQGADEIMIIGGAQIYGQALSLADRLYLTEVDLDIAGDAYFPKFDKTQWHKTILSTHEATSDKPGFVIVQYDRV